MYTVKRYGKQSQICELEATLRVKRPPTSMSCELAMNKECSQNCEVKEKKDDTNKGHPESWELALINQ